MLQSDRQQYHNEEVVDLLIKLQQNMQSMDDHIASLEDTRPQSEKRHHLLNKCEIFIKDYVWA